MGLDPITLLAAATIGSAAVSLHQGEKSASAAKASARQTKRTTEMAAAQQSRELNAANAKAPDVGALLKESQQGGGASTLLTGPAGVDPNLLTLGRSTLLGGGG